MNIKKRYGEGKRDACPFCKRQALTVSKQGLPVCLEHKNNTLPDMKCACGSYLDLRQGKFGAFFSCIKCGNINLSRALEMNDIQQVKEKAQHNPGHAPEKKSMREIVVRADDPLYFS